MLDTTALLTMTVHELELAKLDLVCMYHRCEIKSLKEGLIRSIKAIEAEIEIRNRL